MNYNNLFKSAITDMLRTLDPYSHYYGAEEFDAFKVEPRNGGIGVTIDHRKIGDETPGYTLTEQQLDANRQFIARQLRHDLVTAAYGPITSARILRADDPQVLKAIEALPRAAALAAEPRSR